MAASVLSQRAAFPEKGLVRNLENGSVTGVKHPQWFATVYRETQVLGLAIRDGRPYVFHKDYLKFH